MKLAMNVAIAVMITSLLLIGDAGGRGIHGGKCSITIHDRAIDFDNDGVIDALEIEGSAVLDSAGTYSLMPTLQLHPEPGLGPGAGGFSPRAFEVWRSGNWPIVNPAHDSLDLDGHRVATDAQHRVHFVFRFDGEQLGRFRKDGPWYFCPEFQGKDNIDPNTGLPRAGEDWITYEPSVPTRRWSYRQFGSAPAYLGKVTWSLERDRSIRLAVPLDVKRAARLTIKAKASAGSLAADTTITTSQRAGYHTLRIRLRIPAPSGEVPQPIDPKLLQLVVDLSDSSGVRSDSWGYPLRTPEL